MRTALCLIAATMFFGGFAGCRAPQPAAPTPAEPEDAVIAAQAVIPRSASDEESGSDPEQTFSSEQGAPPLPGLGDGRSEMVTGSPDVLVFELDDGLRSRKAWGADRQMILTDSVTVHLDGQRVPHAFSDDGESYLLTVSLPDDLAPGEHAVDVQFQNMHKNSVLNPHFLIAVP